MVEEKVKKIILEQYSSLKSFADAIGLPYSTVDSIFKRGFVKSNVSNVIDIAKKLNLDVEGLANNQIIEKTIASPAKDELLLKKYHEADTGIQLAVDKLLDIE